MNTLDDILEDFSEVKPGSDQSGRKSITVWLPEAHKNLYDALQKRSGGKLSKKIRQIVIATLDKASQKVG